MTSLCILNHAQLLVIGFLFLGACHTPTSICCISEWWNGTTTVAQCHSWNKGLWFRRITPFIPSSSTILPFSWGPAELTSPTSQPMLGVPDWWWECSLGWIVTLSARGRRRYLFFWIDWWCRNGRSLPLLLQSFTRVLFEYTGTQMFGGLGHPNVKIRMFLLPFFPTELLFHVIPPQ